MILLNFSHPFTSKQLEQLEELTGNKLDRVIEIDAQINPGESIVSQITAMVEQAKLTAREWQTLPILINPPSLNFSAVTLLAELHGRCGYFPPVVRLLPVLDAVPPFFEVAEIINLQIVRDKARKER